MSSVCHKKTCLLIQMQKLCKNIPCLRKLNIKVKFLGDVGTLAAIFQSTTQATKAITLKFVMQKRCNNHHDGFGFFQSVALWLICLMYNNSHALLWCLNVLFTRQMKLPDLCVEIGQRRLLNAHNVYQQFSLLLS